MEKALYFANGIIYITELAVAIYLFVALVLFIFKWCQFVPVRSSAKIDSVEKLETKVAVQGSSLNKSEKILLTEEKHEKQVSPASKVKFSYDPAQEIAQDKKSDSIQSDKVRAQSQPQTQTQAPRSSKSSNKEEKTRNSKSPNKPPQENDKMSRMSKTSNKIPHEEHETEKTQRTSRMSQKLSLEEREIEKMQRISKTSNKLLEENGNAEVNQDNVSSNSKSKSPENKEKP